MRKPESQVLCIARCSKNAFFALQANIAGLSRELLVGTEKVPQRKRCDKDFAERSGEFSGVICRLWGFNPQGRHFSPFTF